MPIGPVAVFGASNFPLAFSVPGGDTASALASGCAVVAKAHSSHPATSARSLAALRSGAERVGAPPGTVALVFGTAAGRRLVAHPAIAAVGFTGSLSGGRALLDVIATRDEPIPFYGELSSLNPVVVTPAAAAERGADIGAGLVASVAVGSGQLCTKPGIVLVPGDAGGEALVEAARSAVGEIAEAVLLNGRIRDEYVARTEVLTDLTTATLGSEGPTGAGFQARPAVFETTLADFRPEMGEEVFGPATLVVRYPPDALVRSVSEVLDLLPSSLTATVHRGTDEDVTGLVPLLADRAGRLVFDGYPTGVAVSWAQTHGGPWPSTNALHTSVGATSTRRFLRPVTYQNAPSSVLPVELLDDVHEVPRRVDGVLELAEGAA